MYLTNHDALLAALQSVGEAGKLDQKDAYTSAIGDMLLMLGLVTSGEQGITVNGENAQLFIKSMVAHLSDNIPLAMDWQTGLTHKAAAQGAQLLAEVEALRKESIAHPTPVREVSAVNALIVKRHESRTLIYMQYDDKARQYQLIGGKVEPEDADAEHTLLREMQEELLKPELRLNEHFRLTPLAERFEKVSMSPTFGVVTGYTIRFFHVAGLTVALPVDQDNAWIDADEVRGGLTRDGRKVSDLPLLFSEIWGTLPDSV